MRKTILLFLLIVVTTQNTRATSNYGLFGKESDSTILAPVLTKIEEMIEAGNLPSLSLGILKDGRVLFKRSFGFANVETNRHATPKTSYTIGSVSKSITATGLMILVQKGLIDLDQPVNNYLESTKIRKFKETDAEITVKQLLNCTGGIPHGWDILNIKDSSQVEESNKHEKLQMAIFPAGETYLYSNFAYGLAAQIVEDVSGLSFGEFMKKEVFAPLKMDNSFVNLPLSNNHDIGVLYEGVHSLEYGIYTSPVGGAGMYSSLDDMLNYGAMHLGYPLNGAKQILNRKSLKIMHSSKSHSNPNWFMTIGWHRLELEGGLTVLISNGEVLGGNVTLLLIPKERICLIAMTNKSFAPSISDEIVFEVANAMIPSFREKLGQRITEYQNAVFEDYHPNDELIGTWEGIVQIGENSKKALLEFQEDGDILLGIEGQLMTIVNNPIYEHGTLRGKSFGYIFEVTKNSGLKELDFHLRRKDGCMYGYLAEISEKITERSKNVRKTEVRVAKISLDKIKE